MEEDARLSPAPPPVVMANVLCRQRAGVLQAASVWEIISSVLSVRVELCVSLGQHPLVVQRSLFRRC